MPDKYTFDSDRDFYFRAQGKLERGDEVELSEVAAEEFDHLFKKVENDDGGPPDPEDSVPFDPRDYSVAELRELLNDADLSEDEMAALKQLENQREGGPRSTALSAIESARD